jgi:hypothetical protein
VQHADNAEVGVPEFVGKGLQGFGGTAHEDGVDLGIAVLHQAVEVFGQGEDEVEVLDGQQLQLAVIDPGGALGCAAFGAVAVAAGVVADLHVAAVVALIDMAAERGGAAGLDGVQGAALLEARMVLGAVGGAMHAHHIGQFEWRWSIFDGELAADFGGEAVHADSIVGFCAVACPVQLRSVRLRSVPGSVGWMWF